MRALTMRELASVAGGGIGDKGGRGGNGGNAGGTTNVAEPGLSVHAPGGKGVAHITITVNGHSSVSAGPGAGGKGGG
jgi:hypothetical protein